MSTIETREQNALDEYKTKTTSASVFDAFRDAQALDEKLRRDVIDPDQFDRELARRDALDLRAQYRAAAEQIAAHANRHDRELSPNESEAFGIAMRRVDELAEDVQHMSAVDRQRADWEKMTGMRTRPEVSPLAVRASMLDSIQNALETRTPGRWVAREEEQRAALTTTATGGRKAWTAPALRGPRLLHVAAGVPADTGIAAITADYLKVTPSAAVAGVGENVSLAEYTGVASAIATLARFGRWTDLSRESTIASDAAAVITGAHRRAVATDLDKVLIDLLATAGVSGTALTSTNGNPALLRKMVATVCDNSGCAPADVTLVLPVAASETVEAITPTSGGDLAEEFTRFAGALLYVTSATAATVAIAFDRSSVKWLEAAGLQLDNDLNVKTATQTLATSVIGGYAAGLVAGGAVKGTLV